MDFNKFETEHEEIMSDFRNETSGWDQATTGDTMSKIYSYISTLMFQIEMMDDENKSMSYDLWEARRERDDLMFG